ncbi:hypothetical protein DICPUDRAFT_152743 [Dictyostelium purpureum]|uniref:F5/8 type C domain-containing protein n=1 Tax=Dictyostelium purpureum TaxID=5786 RepID=F0ZM63_DICPU|nr:uncharacterized protein DICPUDRAFT_152743 [Dictyostelium purpureum]EGC34973.1 hypothetical protein DICPUDRAFT_152743 [Dictyostelium purpureum]|eukprot:XP_003288498.1 hypothetical protein DICPUDRAFT_152743 [Dictyostelium purpureum]
MSNQNLTGLVPVIYNAMVSLRTSTNYDGNHTAANCALFTRNDQSTDRDGSEAWCASVNDTNQYIIAGTDVLRTYVAITLQGRGDSDQWVTAYKLRYTADGVTWVDYRNGGSIQGNWDRNTPNTHFFDAPFRARSISLIPLSWQNHIALRMELYAKPFSTTFVQNGKVQTGEKSLLANGTLNAEVVVPVVFEEEFLRPPKISISFSKSETTVGQSYQTRYGVITRNVTNKGFDAVFQTTVATRVNNLIAEYIAISQE